MNRLIRTPFAVFLHLVLVFGLTLSPFAHALNLPMLPAPAQSTLEQDHTPPCHQGEAPAGIAELSADADTEAGHCCCKNGSVCHCAAAVALPAVSYNLAAPAAHAYSVSLPRFSLGNLPPPEPPPPRA